MRDLLEMVHRAATFAEPYRPTPKKSQEFELGRVLAAQFVDAVRAGDKTEDGLMLAIGLVGGAGGETLRGFLREIHESIVEVRQ